ncbi:MAG TPA: hypothetical protein VMU56_08660 [Beijerinckiaceae bacterium]|nr:hypothetical protein [Beijerinckiaceae bacterium]
MLLLRSPTLLAPLLQVIMQLAITCLAFGHAFCERNRNCARLKTALLSGNLFRMRQNLRLGELFLRFPLLGARFRRAGDVDVMLGAGEPISEL